VFGRGKKKAIYQNKLADGIVGKRKNLSFFRGGNENRVGILGGKMSREIRFWYVGGCVSGET
jgi:hypothetical protein